MLSGASQSGVSCATSEDQAWFVHTACGEIPETSSVFVGKAHSIETLNCHANTLVQERSFPRIGCAKHGSFADFCYEAASFV